MPSETVKGNFQKIVISKFHLISRNFSQNRLMSEEKSGPIVQKAKSKRKYYDETSAEGSELPIKFTSSNAFGAISSERLGLGQREKKMPPPKIQNHSLIISMSVFMLYFFYLREENDLDLMITDLGKGKFLSKIKFSLVMWPKFELSRKRLDSNLLYKCKFQRITNIK